MSPPSRASLRRTWATRSAGVSSTLTCSTPVRVGSADGAGATAWPATDATAGWPSSRTRSSAAPPKTCLSTSSGSGCTTCTTFAAIGTSWRAATCASTSLPRGVPPPSRYAAPLASSPASTTRAQARAAQRSSCASVLTNRVRTPCSRHCARTRSPGGSTCPTSTASTVSPGSPRAKVSVSSATTDRPASPWASSSISTSTSTLIARHPARAAPEPAARRRPCPDPAPPPCSPAAAAPATRAGRCPGVRHQVRGRPPASSWPASAR